MTRPRYYALQHKVTGAFIMASVRPAEDSGITSYTMHQPHARIFSTASEANKVRRALQVAELMTVPVAEDA